MSRQREALIPGVKSEGDISLNNTLPTLLSPLTCLPLLMGAIRTLLRQTAAIAGPATVHCHWRVATRAGIRAAHNPHIIQCPACLLLLHHSLMLHPSSLLLYSVMLLSLLLLSLLATSYPHNLAIVEDTSLESTTGAAPPTEICTTPCHGECLPAGATCCDPVTGSPQSRRADTRRLLPSIPPLR